MMTPLFVAAVLAALVASAAAAELSVTNVKLLACGCPDCCEITTVDTKLKNDFQLSNSSATQVYGGAYDMVVADYLEDVELTNMEISFVTPATISCTGSYAHAFSTDGAFNATVAMTNNGNKGCRISWDGVFDTPEDFAGLDLYMVYRFADLVGTDEVLSGKAFVFPDSTPIVTKDELFAPSFQVISFYGQNGASDGLFDTVFNISRNAFTDDECSFPPTVTFTYSGCAPRTATLSSLSTGRVSYVDTMNRTVMDDCAADTSESGNDIVYRMDPSVSFDRPRGCLSTKDVLPDGDDRTVYNIRAAATVSDDASTDVNQLVMLVQNYTTVPCDGRVVPMAKVQVVVKMSTSISPLARDLYDGTALLDQTNMIRNASASSCEDWTSFGGNHICYETYTSEECMLMNNTEPVVDDDTVDYYYDPTDVGSVTCGFVRLGYMDVKAKYDYPSFSEVADLKNPLLGDSLFSGDECAVVAVQQDVRTQFPVNLTLDGNNLNNFINATLEFVDLTDDATVTLTILNVYVTLENGEYSHTYDIADKLALLSRSQTPYYRDAHFCRHEVARDVCSPFYDPDSSRWNPFYELNQGFFDVPNQGFDGCQLNNQRALDRFSFIPNYWVFDEFRGETSTMYVKVTARVNTCATAMELEQRRMLQGSDPASEGALVPAGGDTAASAPIQIVFGEGQLTIGRNEDGVIVVVEDESPEGDDDGDSPPVWTIVLGGAGAVFFCFFFIILAVRRRKRRQGDEDVTSTEKPTGTLANYA